MRTAVWYLISVSLHGAVMAAMAFVTPGAYYQPPLYGVVRGGGGGLGGASKGETSTLESPLSSSWQKTTERLLRLRIEPVAVGVKRDSPIFADTKIGTVPLKKVSPEVARQQPATLTETARSLSAIHIAPPKLPRTTHSIARSVPLQRTVPRLSSLDVVAATVMPEPMVSQQTTRAGSVGSVSSGNEGGQALGGARHRVVGGKTGSGSPGSSGDGRPGRPGAGGPDQTPSAFAWNPAPPYPPEALARGIEGLVILRVWIRDDGTLQAVSVHQSSGDVSLDESALNTVRDRWEFVPAQKNGLNIPSQALLPIRFRLRNG